ncbi:hypothetical protein WICPIJ_005060 [Wickerhamomyces pijperi]|uniref:Uncharacterized protein n=1 Tax=Wickerhamomyces pijperi TaxID=599730 RepID=A0A9P8Q6G5_WICPI|nr:hypothetical protein WICPIJ_005060 [Wickerhamomyces pijperi]
MNTTAATQEDMIAQSILKKAELAKITKQLKTRLARTSFTNPSSSSSSPVSSKVVLSAGASGNTHSVSVSSSPLKFQPQLKRTPSSFNVKINKLLLNQKNNIKKTKDAAAAAAAAAAGSPVKSLMAVANTEVTVTRASTPTPTSTPLRSNLFSSSTKSLRGSENDFGFDEMDSPIKSRKIQRQFPPSSPVYHSSMHQGLQEEEEGEGEEEEEDNSTFIIPRTPPQQKMSLATESLSTISTNKTQINPISSSPYHPASSAATGNRLHHVSLPPMSPARASNIRTNTVATATNNNHNHNNHSALLSTPKRGTNGTEEEDASLLLLLASSPSPSVMRTPSTPSRFKPANVSSNLVHVDTSTSITAKSATSIPVGQLRNNNSNITTVSTSTATTTLPSFPQLNSVINTPQSQPPMFQPPSLNVTLLPPPQTPFKSFNMDDYVNFYTPSPRTGATGTGTGNNGVKMSGGLSVLGQRVQFNSAGFDVNGKQINF